MIDMLRDFRLACRILGWRRGYKVIAMLRWLRRPIPQELNPDAYLGDPY